MGNQQISTLTTGYTLYYNGTFIILDAANTIAVGLVVKDQKIIQILHTDQEVESSPIQTRIDMGGKTVVPGFVMSHTHLQSYGMLCDGITVSPMNIFFNPNYSPPTTSAEVLQRIADESHKRIDDSIFAQGYDPVLQPGPIIDRIQLDQISTEFPIYLMSGSMHNLYVNTQTLIKAGLVEKVNPDGSIVLNNKVPNKAKEEVEEGCLSEENMFLVAQTFPIVTVDSMIYHIDRASIILNKKGITTVGDASVPAPLFPLYRKYSRLIPRIRIIAFPVYNMVSSHGSFVRIDTNYLTNDYFYIGPTKVIADGSTPGYTAFLTEPYSTPPFFTVPNPETWCGAPECSKYQLQKAFENILRSGYRIAVHGNGDASIDDILDAFENAQNKYQVPDHRTRIEHSTTVRQDQLVRMKNLGVHPSFLSNHIYYYGDVFHDQILGPDRSNNIDPMNDALQVGIVFDTHSDSPVTPPDPIFQIWEAVNRITQSGRILGENQSIDVLNALRSVTINSAYTLGIDHKVGSLEVGKLADMIVLSDNILTIDKLAIKDIKIISTYLGGKKLE